MLTRDSELAAGTSPIAQTLATGQGKCLGGNAHATVHAQTPADVAAATEILTPGSSPVVGTVAEGLVTNGYTGAAIEACHQIAARVALRPTSGRIGTHICLAASSSEAWWTGASGLLDMAHTSATIYAEISTLVYFALVAGETCSTLALRYSQLIHRTITLQ